MMTRHDDLDLRDAEQSAYVTFACVDKRYGISHLGKEQLLPNPDAVHDRTQLQLHAQ